MAEIIVPRWFIKGMILQRGMRLPKKPIWVEASETRTRSGYGFAPLSIPSHPSSGPMENWKNVDLKRRISTVDGGSFDPTDFRFFGCYYNVYDKIQKCTCRSCGGVIISEQLRRKHQDVLGCYERLVEAYKLLEMDSKCVICDKHTGIRKWSVPLCSKDCVYEWCFKTIRPEGLSAALDLIPDRRI